MTKSNKIIRCDNCGAKNRVEIDRKAVCGKCKSPLDFVDSPVTVTDSNFKTVVEDSKQTVLLDLWAAWCPPCKMLAPIIDEIARETAGIVRVGKLDVDGNPVTAGKFGVQSIPTLLILQDGKEVDRIVGMAPKEAILNRLKPYQ